MKLINFKNWSHENKTVGEFDIYFIGVRGTLRSSPLQQSLSNNENVYSIAEDDSEAITEKETIKIDRVLLANNIDLFFEDYFKKYQDSNNVKIFVDVSSLSRKIISNITFLTFKYLKKGQLSLTYAYQLAKFKKPNLSTFINKEIKPVHHFFSGWPKDPTNPTSLIIGLGYERNQAEGAAEYFDSNVVWKLIPTSKEPEYLDEIRENNKYLIDANGNDSKNNVIYDLHDMSQTFGQLEILTTGLIENTNPVFLPFGPRILFALCLMLSVIHPECGVWCISENKMKSQFDEEPTEHLFGFTAIYSLE
jgi:hypothetical protein